MIKKSEATEGGTKLVYRIKDLSIALGISRVSLHRLNAAGKIPRPSKLGRTVVWSIEEIRAWLSSGSPDRAKWDAIWSAERRRR